MKCLNCGCHYNLPKKNIRRHHISRWYCSNSCAIFLRNIQKLQCMNEGIQTKKRGNYYIYRLGITKTIKERNKLYKKLYS